MHSMSNTTSRFWSSIRIPVERPNKFSTVRGHFSTFEIGNGSSMVGGMYVYGCLRLLQLYLLQVQSWWKKTFWMMVSDAATAGFQNLLMRRSSKQDLKGTETSWRYLRMYAERKNAIWFSPASISEENEWYLRKAKEVRNTTYALTAMRDE